MRLHHVHVCTKSEVNRSKNTATVTQKPPKLTFLRDNVATLLSHSVFFLMVRCAYTVSMSVLNLKQISRKTRPQWLKTAQNGRSYVITSRRRYVMTSFSIWYDAIMPCSCLYQIWSKSVEKHGHSGPKTARNGPKWTFLRHNVATSLRHDVFFHRVRCAYTMPMAVLNLK